MTSRIRLYRCDMFRSPGCFIEKAARMDVRHYLQTDEIIRHVFGANCPFVSLLIPRDNITDSLIVRLQSRFALLVTYLMSVLAGHLFAMDR